jgi:putative nucleotidyltransferase with HDIG domain
MFMKINPASLRPVPSRAECLVLMKEQGMLPNIWEHSLQVARVAMTLGAHLLPANPGLDLALLEAGALLHDIAKTACLQSKERHTEVGAALLQGLGFPEVAEIVAQHVNLKEEHPENHGITEIEIVHYADKRVLHEEIVSLPARFEYLQERYGRSPAERLRISALLESSLKQEEKIFRDLPFAPVDLKYRVDFRNG